MPNRDVKLFWEVVDPLLARGAAERGTMMGHPCVRVGGSFFATAGHSGNELIVKLPASRVDALIAKGVGVAFAPAGRRFKEWVAVPRADRRLWRRLVDEALAFAGGP